MREVKTLLCCWEESTSVENLEPWAMEIGRTIEFSSNLQISVNNSRSDRIEVVAKEETMPQHYGCF